MSLCLEHVTDTTSYSQQLSAAPHSRSPSATGTRSDVTDVPSGSGIATASPQESGVRFVELGKTDTPKSDIFCHFTYKKRHMKGPDGQVRSGTHGAVRHTESKAAGFRAVIQTELPGRFRSSPARLYHAFRKRIHRRMGHLPPPGFIARNRRGLPRGASESGNPRFRCRSLRSGRRQPPRHVPGGLGQQ